MKVYGGLIFNSEGKQIRAIIACKNKKEAIVVLRKKYSPKYSSYHFTNYWIETRRDIEINLALKNPYKILIAMDYHETKFEIYKEGK